MTLPKSELQKFSGKYQDDSGSNFKIVLENRTLVLHELDHLPISLLPDSDLHFFLDGAEDETFFFDKDSTGKVIAVERTHCQYGYSGMAFSTARKVK